MLAQILEDHQSLDYKIAESSEILSLKGRYRACTLQLGQAFAILEEIGQIQQELQELCLKQAREQASASTEVTEIALALENQYKQAYLPNSPLLELGISYLGWTHPELIQPTHIPPSRQREMNFQVLGKPLPREAQIPLALQDASQWPRNLVQAFEKFIGKLIESEPKPVEKKPSRKTATQSSPEEETHSAVQPSWKLIPRQHKRRLKIGAITCSDRLKIQAFKGKLGFFDLQVQAGDWFIVQLQCGLENEQLQRVYQETFRLAEEMKRPLGKKGKEIVPFPWKEDLLSVLRDQGLDSQGIRYALNIPVNTADGQVIQQRLKLTNDHIPNFEVLKPIWEIAQEIAQQRPALGEGQEVEIWKSDLYEAISIVYPGQEKKLIPHVKRMYSEEEVREQLGENLEELETKMMQHIELLQQQNEDLKQALAEKDSRVEEELARVKAQLSALMPA